MASPCRYLCILLLVYVHPPGNSAEVTAALKMMTPLINTKYYVLCEIQTSSEFEDSDFYDYPVIIKDRNVVCSITDWRYCSKPPPEQKHGACGCSGKILRNIGIYEYTFYLLIDPVTNLYIGSQFSCAVSSVLDTRQMEVVIFTRQPERMVYACKNSSVQFDWEFSPFRESIVNAFRVARVTWRIIGTGGGSQHLGTFSRLGDGKHDFVNDGNGRTTLTWKNTILPQLQLSNLMMADSDKFIRINVTFNITRSNWRNKRLQLSDPLELNETTTSQPTLTTAAVNTVVEDTVVTTITSTVSTVSTTPPRPIVQETTTPAPVKLTLDLPERSLIDIVRLIVTEPPSPETRLSVRAVESITGSLVITCQALYMSHAGVPPVNITIWHDQLRLITRSGIKILHYSTPTEGKIISCSLEGHALDCLSATDPRVQKQIFSINDLEKSTKPIHKIDMLLSLYAWESIICLALVFWTISLFLDHLKLVVRRARLKLEESKRSMLLKERQRQRRRRQYRSTTQSKLQARPAGSLNQQVNAEERYEQETVKEYDSFSFSSQLQQN